jgi:hypothetical protein
MNELLNGGRDAGVVKKKKDMTSSPHKKTEKYAGL